MALDKTPRRLGRGLDALLGQRPVVSPQGTQQPIQPTTAHTTPSADQSTVPTIGTDERASVNANTEQSALREIPISAIAANKYQPRKTFNDEELAELRDSIRSSGLLQPITVRQLSDNTGYELVAGERRLRAARQLNWASIPAIVRDYDDRTMLTLALVENLQREDLNPIEEADGYARLSNEFGLSHSEIADLVGKDRSTIANFLRILQLPQQVHRLLETGDLTLGHARPLLALDNEALIVQLAEETAQLGLTVRAVEERVRHDAPKSTKPKRGRPPRTDDRPNEVKHVESLLRQRLQTDVAVQLKKGQHGELKIAFYSYDDLNRLLELMNALED